MSLLPRHRQAALARVLFRATHEATKLAGCWAELGCFGWRFKNPGELYVGKDPTPAFVKLFPIAGPKVASYGQLIAFSVSLLGFGGFWLFQSGHRTFDGRFTGVLGGFWRSL